MAWVLGVGEDVAIGPTDRSEHQSLGSAPLAKALDIPAIEYQLDQ